MAIEGLATKEGTTQYIERFPSALESSSYRRFRRLRVSSIGIGTYLGSPTDDDDRLYAQSLEAALLNGCNVIDTAINYRHMRSERVTGEVLKRLVGRGAISRSEVLVCTKGGYLPFDDRAGISDPAEYRRQRFYVPGVLKQEETEALLHSLDPQFLRLQLEQSLANLGLSGVDIFYLHNPETQYRAVTKLVLREMLRKAFRMLEEAVSEKKIGCYGLATWNAFRVGESEGDYFSLQDILQLATEVGGATHNFAAVQLPLNLAQTEAIAIRSQKTAEGEDVSFCTAASKARVAVFTSASLGQGRLIKYLSPLVKRHFRSLPLDTYYAIQFARSCPAVCTALVGMKHPAHVQENLGLFKYQPDAPENFVRLFQAREDDPLS